MYEKKKKERAENIEEKDLEYERIKSGPAQSLFSADFCAALDSTTAPIYIIDPESFELLYCNEFLCNHLGWNPLGETCYKAIRGLKEPCSNCVASKLYREGINETTEYFTPQGNWILVRVSPLKWKGRDLCKLISFDITRQKQLEAKLRLLGGEYGSVVRHSASGILRYDIESGAATLSVDGKLNKVEEYCIPDYLHVICESGMVKGESLLAVKAMFLDIGQGETSKGYDVQLCLDNDRPCWYRLDYALITDDEGRPHCAAVSFYDNTEQKEKERLTRRAERDIMTGLYNRATTEGLIQKALEKNAGQRCCFMIIDLDDLREINGSLGHPEGDRALIFLAECMEAQFGAEGILGRIGGDEFAVFLKKAPEDAQIKALASEFLKKVNEISIGPENDWPIHASVGGVIGGAEGDDFKTLYRKADLALFYTKAMGKNDFYLYEPGLEKREFHYQPRSAATLAEMESFDSADFKKLLQAVSAYFPMVISVNLTKNTYYMMEYMSYAMQEHKDQGNFDQLIEEGADSFHPDDRESFVQSFSRENLLKAYARGERIVRHVGRQLGDDGIYRMAQGVVVFVNDENTGDICEITFSHMTFAEGERL